MMIKDRYMLTAAEMAFFAEVTDRDVARLVDEHILPDSLFDVENGRRFDRCAAPLARFYFGAKGILTAETRKCVINELAERIAKVEAAFNTQAEAIAFARCFAPSNLNPRVDVAFVNVDMQPFVTAVCERAVDAERADKSVISDPEILGGEPVFAGTRVPIDTVIGALAEGMSFDELQESWKFLTEQLIEDARNYQELHPRRGRPRGPAGETGAWKLVSRKVISPEGQ
jgi:uncharacterized protein (DUF433 family)